MARTNLHQGTGTEGTNCIRATNSQKDCKTFYYKRIQDVGSNKGKCHKKPKLRPRQIHTYIYSFTLLRWDPVTLRKDEDKKQNSNKQLLGRQLIDHKWCALQKKTVLFAAQSSFEFTCFLSIKMDLRTEHTYFRKDYSVMQENESYSILVSNSHRVFSDQFSYFLHIDFNAAEMLYRIVSGRDTTLVHPSTSTFLWDHCN